MQALDLLGRKVVMKSGAALANAHLFLEAFGHGVLAWSWLKQAVVADAALPAA